MRVRTFLKYFVPASDAFVRTANDIYALDLGRVALLEVVQGAQRVVAESVCAAEEDSQGFMLIFCWCCCACA